MPGLIIDKVGGGSNIALQNIYKEGDYNSLKVLKEEGKLIPGQKYLLKGYQTKYIINGSDTASIMEEGFVNSMPYNYYHMFDTGVAWPTLKSGDYFTVSYLPPSYSGSVKVGDRFRISAAYGDGGFRVPGLPLVMGLGVTYQAAFYNNIYVSGKTIKERFYSDLTGVVTSTANTNIITGVGTAFTLELQPGDSFCYFVDAGYRYDRVVESITSDTELIITQQVLAEDIATGVLAEKLTFGKAIMRPGGLINTDVHDGTPYSGMTAAENAAPPIEDLVLTAMTATEFNREAESATFIGDQVEYLFDDTEVKDRSGNLTATRPGIVIYRENKKLKIRVDKDWRAQKYRRFRMNDDHWSRMNFNNKDLYKLASEAKDGGNGHTYYVGGINALSQVEGKRYMLRDVERGFRIQDFTMNGQEANPFTSGFLGSDSTYYPSNDPNKLKYYSYAAIASHSVNSVFAADLSLNFNEIQVKDFHIIPLDENSGPASIVTRFEVDNLENSAFLALNKAQGVSNYINVDCNHIQDSVFFTGGKITAKNGSIAEVTSLEDFDIVNAGEIVDLINFTGLQLVNNGSLKSVQFGGAYRYPIDFCGQARLTVSSSSSIICSVFGIGHCLAPIHITDTVCKDFLLKYFCLGNNIMRLNGVYFSLSNSEDHDYLGSDWFSKAATAGCVIDLMPGWYKNTGIEYWLQGPVRDKEIKTKTSDKTLYYETISSTGVKAIISIGQDGTETEQAITQENIRLKDVVLGAANWKQNVDTGKWEYLIENELITSSSEVKFIPTTGSLDIVFAVEISPFTPAVAGGILVSANIQPTVEILVDLLISPVQDV